MKAEQIYRHLSQFTVGIAGAGGLGSNCAVALARTGIGRLVIADFDRVSISNLNRQYYFTDQVGILKVDALKENLRRVNPSVIVETHAVKLDAGLIENLYAGCDIIVEAFDEAEMKEMIAETVLDALPGKPLVMGSGMAGWGATAKLRERYLGRDLVVCGDESSEVSEDNPPLAPRVGIVASMQANAVLEILMKKKRKQDEDNAE